MSSTEQKDSAVDVNVNLPTQQPSSKPVGAVWNAGDPTDGREYYEYQSKYPPCTRIQIFLEAFYLALILILGFYLLIWIFSGTLVLYHSTLGFNDLNPELRKLITFNVAGFIGGSMFGLKYLYHVTARGLWHEDRRIWRVFSPWLAAALATMIGILIDGGFVDIANGQSDKNPYSTYTSVGFIAGYFADTALAKLQEIATVIFGSSSKSPFQGK